MKVLRGVIDTTGAGTINFGSGFTINRNGVGDLTITFTAAFSARPAVTLTAEGAGGDRTANIDTTTAPSASVVRVRRQIGTTGAANDGVFHFYAIGPR